MYIYIYVCMYVCIYVMIFLHLETCLHESILVSLPLRHLLFPHYCNTIARLLRSVRPPPRPPFVWHTQYNTGSGNIM